MPLPSMQSISKLKDLKPAWMTAVEVFLGSLRVILFLFAGMIFYDTLTIEDYGQVLLLQEYKNNLMCAALSYIVVDRIFTHFWNRALTRVMREQHNRIAKIMTEYADSTDGDMKLVGEYADLVSRGFGL